MYNVVLLANLKKNAPKIPHDKPKDIWADLDSEQTIEDIMTALQSAGHKVTFLEANFEIVSKLRAMNPDICFNIAEGHFGDSRATQIPAILDMLQIPYTGSGILAQACSFDKGMTKMIWQSTNLSTAPYQVFTNSTQILNPNLEFPLFVKPTREGTGIGISSASIVNNEAELIAQIVFLLRKYEEPVLVEPYLSGREFTVGILGNKPYQEVLPPVEIDFGHNAQNKKVYGSDLKTTDKVMHIAQLEVSMLEKLKQMALGAHNSIGALDVSRVDIRCDNNGTPFLLEINLTPGLSKGFSDLAVAAEQVKSYEWLINTILNIACNRYGMKSIETDFSSI